MSKPVARRSRRGISWKVLLSLLVCFPYGLALMWRKARWHVAVKSFVTLCFVVLTGFILLPMTTPPTPSTGGVQLIGAEKDVEVYGPELPATLDSAYAVAGIDVNPNANLFASVEETPVTYVYANENGKYYHKSDCKYVAWYSDKMTIPQAHYAGYTPCALCEPGPYVPGMAG